MKTWKELTGAQRLIVGIILAVVVYVVDATTGGNVLQTAGKVLDLVDRMVTYGDAVTEPAQ